MSTAEDRSQASEVRSAMSGDAEELGRAVSNEANQPGSAVSKEAGRAARFISNEAEGAQRQVAVRAGEAAAQLSSEAKVTARKLSSQAAQQADKFLRQEEQAAGNTSRKALGEFRLFLGLAPALPVAALAALAIFLAIWWMEHNAHLRSEGALKEAQRQTNAQVADLQAKADAAVRDANQNNARAVSELEASRRVLDQQSQDLRQRLGMLEGVERTRVAQVAALSAPEVWKRLGDQLGSASIAPQGTTDSSGHRVVESLKDQGASNGPMTQSHPGSTLQNGSTPGTSGITLTELGARKVETALVELDSCRQESTVEAQQLSTCQKEGVAEAAMVARQKSSIAELNQALADKDQILAKRQIEFKAELKVAHGSLLSRVGRVAEYVALGIVAGKVL